jgi:hypothetical protein
MPDTPAQAAKPAQPNLCPPCAIKWGGETCPRLASGVATYAARTLARFGQGPATLPARSFPACATHGAEARRMAAEGWGFEPYAP